MARWRCLVFCVCASSRLGVCDRRSSVAARLDVERNDLFGAATDDGMHADPVVLICRYSHHVQVQQVVRVGHLEEPWSAAAFQAKDGFRNLVLPYGALRPLRVRRNTERTSGDRSRHACSVCRMPLRDLDDLGSAC